MCTLTYIPKKNGAIFTSNRDEHESRGNTMFPVVENYGGKEIVFPRDPKAGGSWIALANDNTIAILLNGAFEKHKHTPPYKKSRGLVLLDLFEFENISDFNDSYELIGVEPFTLVYFQESESIGLFEFRWDGDKKYLKKIDASKAQIWSSVTLYSPKIIQDRKQWFLEWLAAGNTNAKDMLRFHEFGGKDTLANNFRMNRGNGLKTISISQINLLKDTSIFNYKNLVNNSIELFSFQNSTVFE